MMSVKNVPAYSTANEFLSNLSIEEAKRLVELQYATWRGRKKYMAITMAVSRAKLAEYVFASDHNLSFKQKWNALGKHSKGHKKKEAQGRIAKLNGNLRRIRELGATGHHTQQEWEKLVEDTGAKCLRCQNPSDAKTLTRDHVIPLACGGAHSIGNIQPLCRSCNSAKHARTIDYRSIKSVVHSDGLFASRQLT